MSAPTVIDIADSLVTVVNEWPDLANRFKAERRMLPTFSAEDLQKLRVTAIAIDCQGEFATRGNSVDEDPIIDLLVQQYLDPKRIEIEAPKLVQLQQDIGDFLRTKARTTSFSGTCLKSIQLLAIYAPEHLRTNSIFTTANRLTFKRIRE